MISHTLRNWMLPVSMTLGVGIFLALRLSGSPGEEGYLRFCAAVQPVLVAVMLFLQLNLVLRATFVSTAGICGCC